MSFSRLVRWSIAGLAISACTIGVKQVDPIVVNLNVKVEQEVRVRIDRELEALMDVEEAQTEVSARGVAGSDATALLDARQEGRVGERPDGYLGLVSEAEGLAAIVDRENQRRRAEYGEIAARTGTDVAVVGVLAAEQRLRRVTPGERVMTPEGDWIRAGT